MPDQEQISYQYGNRNSRKLYIARDELQIKGKPLHEGCHNQETTSRNRMLIYSFHNIWVLTKPTRDLYSTNLHYAAKVIKYIPLEALQTLQHHKGFEVFDENQSEEQVLKNLQIYMLLKFGSLESSLLYILGSNAKLFYHKGLAAPQSHQ